MYFLPVVLLQKLSPSTICLQVLHFLLPQWLTTVSVQVSWEALVASLPKWVGFEDTTSLSQDEVALPCLPFFKGLGQESVTLVCRASDRPLVLVAIFVFSRG